MDPLIRNLSGLFFAFLLVVGIELKADFKDDIDFNKLKAEYGNNLPNGNGVRLAHVEYTRNGYWAPLPEGELAGKNLTYVTSTFGGYSGHANEVGAFLSGSSTSMTPGVAGWLCYEATNYLGGQSLMAGRSVQPMTATWDIENHSWGGNDMINSRTNLMRMDYRIERDNVIVAVGVDNGGSLSQMLANAYNVISVGSSTGDHPHSGSTMEVLGRIKPELVGTRTWTSYATPIVASSATLLVGEINRTPSLSAARSSMVIKALLMAGATKEEFPNWQNSPSKPLDAWYGAGEVNIYNSYKSLVAGRQAPLAATPLNVNGWDANTTSQSNRRLYYFSVPSGKKLSLSAVLAWNRRVQPDSTWKNPTSILTNLDMALWQADGSYNLSAKLVESVSQIDNVEHIYKQELPAGVYALEVIAPVDGEKYGIAWRGHFADDGSAPNSTPPPTQPAPPPPTEPTPPPVSSGLSDTSFELVQVGSNQFYAFAYGPGGSSWTFSTQAGVSGNNSGFTSGNATAPEGAQVGFIQMKGSIEQTCSLNGGSYVITAKAAQRAKYQQQSQTVDVYVDGQKVGTFSPSGTTYSAVSTSSFNIGDGVHTVKLVGQATLDGTMFLDQIALAAAPSTPTPTPQPPPSTPTPSASFTDSGFESPSVGGNRWDAFRYGVTGASWRFSDRSGLSGNGSGFTSGNPGAPEGAQVAFIQMMGTIEQDVYLAGGTYSIGAYAAQRVVWQQQSQTVDVYVDGRHVGTFSPSGSSYTQVSTGEFTVGAGMHTIRFAGRVTQDGTMFLDRLTLTASTTGGGTPVGVTVPGHGFESPSQGTNTFGAFAYRPSGSQWAFAGNSGLAGNRSGFTDTGANAPEGTQVAFLQFADSVISQTLSFPSSGNYTLVVSAAKRGGPWNLQDQVVHVYVAGNYVGSFTPRSTQYETFTLTFSANAGNAVLSFRGSVVVDSTAFIDDVAIIGP